MKPSPLPAPLLSSNPEPPPRDRLSEPRFRNLLLGGAAAFVALVLLAGAVTTAGAGLGLVGFGTALISILLAWLLWRLGLPEQPGGAFATGTLILCGTLVLPLLVGIGMNATQTELRRPAARQTAEVPSAAASPSASAAPAAAGLPLLQDAFPVVRPNPATESWVEVTKDSKIKIDNQFYRINAGETFAFQRIDGDDVIFQVSDFLVSLPATAVRLRQVERSPAAEETTAPPAEKSAQAGGEPRSPLEITRDAQAEAIRRYPALSVQDSRENRTYVEAYMKLKGTNEDFFKDPEWPLQLAEGVAEREGWKREDR